MELSRFERLELHTIASGLQADDPKLAALMGQNNLVQHRWRSVGQGCVVAVLGLLLMLAGFSAGMSVLGTAGFLLLGGGTYWATLPVGISPHLSMTAGPERRRDAHQRVM